MMTAAVVCRTGTIVVYAVLLFVSTFGGILAAADTADDRGRAREEATSLVGVMPAPHVRTTSHAADTLFSYPLVLHR